MITAVDTNILLDVFTADPRFGLASRTSLQRCAAEGSLIACDVVWAEVCGSFRRPADAERALDRLGVGFDALDRDISSAAGSAWRRYREAGGTRRRVLADFLIGAHAVGHADRLLTRERGFYRSYFARLRVLDPQGDKPLR
jgi:hypothetical protein